MSRLTNYITSQQHQSLGSQARQDDQAWHELKSLLGERIEQGLAGKVSTGTIGAIVDEELGPDQHS